MGFAAGTIRFMLQIAITFLFFSFFFFCKRNSSIHIITVKGELRQQVWVRRSLISISYAYTCAWKLSHVTLFTTPRTVAHQALLSMGFPREEHWNGLQFPPPGDLPDLGIKPKSLVSPELVGGFFTTESPGKHPYTDMLNEIMLEWQEQKLCKIL